MEDVDPSDSFTEKRLESLLVGKRVVCRKPELLDQSTSQISAKVYLNDTDIMFYFPEYQSEESKPRRWASIF